MLYETENRLSSETDTRIQSIAAQALANTIPETEARWKIAQELIQSGIPESVARSTGGINQQLREDLIPQLQGLIEKKALQTSDGGLSLTIASEKSASGWARKLARTAVRSAVRDILRETKRYEFVDPTTDLTADDVRLTHAELTFLTSSTEVDLDNLDGQKENVEDDLEAILREFSEAAAGTRSAGRLRLAGKALLKAFHMPDPIRPESSLDREWIRTQIEADHLLARKALVAMYALQASRETKEQRELDMRLLGLWDDFAPDLLLELIKKPAMVVHLLVLCCVSPLPRPSRDVLALAMQTVRMADTGPGWRQFSRDLFESWLAVEVEAVSGFDTKGTLSDEKMAARLSAALAWPELAQQAANRKGHPFGRTVAEVNEWITSVVHTISD